MPEVAINLGRGAQGNGSSDRTVSYWNAQMVPVAIAIASLLFNNQLPGDVNAILLGLAVAASSNDQISPLIAAVKEAGQILQLNAAYSSYTGVIYTSLTTYCMIQVPIFAAIFGAQEPGRCQIWWTAIIVSGLTSAAIIVRFFRIFIFQFNLRSRTRQLQQQLRRQIGVLSVAAMTMRDGWTLVHMPDGWTIVGDAAKEDDDLDINWITQMDINWITQRAAFLLILLAISVCLLLSFTPLLCLYLQ